MNIKHFCKTVAAKKPKPFLLFFFWLNKLITKAINSTAMFYEKKYKGKLVHPKHRLIKYHDFFLSKIKINENILDLGCGYGAVSFSLAKKTQGQVLGIDYNKANINEAKKIFVRPNLVFKIANLNHKIKCQKIDVIILSNVLEHLKNRKAVLLKCKKFYRPKKILVRVPARNRDWTIALQEELGLNYFLDDDHKIEYTAQSLIKEIHRAGMKIKSLECSWGELWCEIIP